MNKVVYLILALLAGFAGGIASGRVMHPRAVGPERSDETAGVIKAKRFALVDEEGETLGHFGLLKGEPGLHLWSKDHRASIWLRVFKSTAVLDVQGASGASLDLRGSLATVSLGDTLSEKGHRRLVLQKTSMPDSSGESKVSFYDTNGEFRAELGLSLSGEPELIFWNTDRRRCAELGVEDGTPALMFLDEAGEIRGWFRLRRDGTPSVSLWDTLGTLRALLSLDADEQPSLVLLDGTERTRACVGATSFQNPKTGVVERHPASSIVLLGKKGEVLWSAP